MFNKGGHEGGVTELLRIIAFILSRACVIDDTGTLSSNSDDVSSVSLNLGGGRNANGGGDPPALGSPSFLCFFAPNHDRQLPFWLSVCDSISSSGVRGSPEPDDDDEEYAEWLAKTCGRKEGANFRESESNVRTFRLVESCGTRAASSASLDDVVDGASALSTRLATKEAIRRMSWL